MPDREIVLPFLASRAYLHMTTLLGSLLPFVVDSDELVLKIARQIRTNRVSYRWLDHCPDAAASCWAADARGRKTIGIYESGPLRDDVRVAYPEDAIIDGWQERDGGALLTSEGPWTFAERLIALNKAYLSRKFPLQRNEQLFATRLEVRGPLPGSGTLRVDHVRTIGGRHHVSRFARDGREMGLLYFSVQPSAS